MLDPKIQSALNDHIQAELASSYLYLSMAAYFEAANLQGSAQWMRRQAQEELEAFNKKWLKGAYETAIVFPGNSGRGQTLGMLAKPGFKIVDRKDQYHLEPDTGKNARGERLFARGPAFVLIESPSGYRFWVGVTHQKSKSDNSVDVTQWRNREATRAALVAGQRGLPALADVLAVRDAPANPFFGPPSSPAQ